MFEEVIEENNKEERKLGIHCDELSPVVEHKVGVSEIIGGPIYGKEERKRRIRRGIFVAVSAVSATIIILSIILIILWRVTYVELRSCSPSFHAGQPDIITSFSSPLCNLIL